MAMPRAGRVVLLILVCDAVCLLFLTSLLDWFCGVMGHLTELQVIILSNFIVSWTTFLITVYFLVWHIYDTWVDQILASVLLVVCGIDGVLAFNTFARLAR